MAEGNKWYANPNEGETSNKKIDIEDFMYLIARKHRVFLDKISVYSTERWVFLVGILVFFLLRVYMTEGKS